MKKLIIIASMAAVGFVLPAAAQTVYSYPADTTSRHGALVPNDVHAIQQDRQEMHHDMMQRNQAIKSGNTARAKQEQHAIRHDEHKLAKDKGEMNKDAAHHEMKHKHHWHHKDKDAKDAAAAKDAK